MRPEHRKAYEAFERQQNEALRAAGVDLSKLRIRPSPAPPNRPPSSYDQWPPRIDGWPPTRVQVVSAQNKEEALTKIARGFAPNKPEQAALVRVVLAGRERCGNSATGRGIAFPGAVLPPGDCDCRVLPCLLIPPVKWGALDERPVSLAFGLLGRGVALSWIQWRIATWLFRLPGPDRDLLATARTPEEALRTIHVLLRAYPGPE